MTLEEIKAKEQIASDWLIANKRHPDFKEKKKRYSVIVTMMNNKTPKMEETRNEYYGKRR